MPKPSSYVFYSGPSLLDGAPIIAVATGCGRRPHNEKTGNMIQTWILRADLHPYTAILTKQDVSVCGQCPHRGAVVQGKKGPKSTRSCYVKMDGPSSVYKAFHRGRYPQIEPWALGRLLRGRAIRIGAYGDPAAVPAQTWRDLVLFASKRTGYTHQWHLCPELKDLVMASIDHPEELDVARSVGWRTFRVRTEGESLKKGEIVCPASQEAGHKTQCERCGLCRGSDAKRDVAIMVHGPSKIHFHNNMLMMKRAA